MRAALYARVSSQSQAEEGWSTEAQLRALRAYCQAHDWSVAGEYLDDGVSAAKESASSRPEFRRMLEDVDARRCDVVVVHKLDRFSRNLVVTFQSLARIERAGVGFVSLTEHIDMTTPTGRLMLGVFALFAQFYSDNLGTEVSKGRSERALAGLPNGDIPFGYASTGDPKQPPIPVGAEAPLVVEVFRRYSGGLVSAHEIASWLNQQGVHPRSKRGITNFTKATVTDMLSNPFYCGRVRYRGEEMPGQHVPIISEELFDLCQAVKTKRTRNPSGNRANASHTYLLRTIGHCAACGEGLWCSPLKTGRRYRDMSNLKQRPCPAHRRSVDADEVEAQIGAIIRRMEFPADWRERVLASVESEQAGDDPARRRKQLQERIGRLRELYLEGEVTRARYDTERAKLRAELDSLEAYTRATAPAEEAGELLRRYAEVWDEAEEEERARITRALFEAVHIDLDAGVVRFVKPRPIFLPITAVLWRDGLLSGDPDRAEVTQTTAWAPLLEEVVLGRAFEVRGVA